MKRSFMEYWKITVEVSEEGFDTLRFIGNPRNISQILISIGLHTPRLALGKVEAFAKSAFHSLLEVPARPSACQAIQGKMPEILLLVVEISDGLLGRCMSEGDNSQHVSSASRSLQTGHRIPYT
jgi:hypothetical protein